MPPQDQQANTNRATEAGTNSNVRKFNTRDTLVALPIGMRILAYSGPMEHHGTDVLVEFSQKRKRYPATTVLNLRTPSSAVTWYHRKCFYGKYKRKGMQCAQGASNNVYFSIELVAFFRQ